MTGAGIGGLIWLGISVFLGLGVVVGWIIKSEINNNVLRGELEKLKRQLDAVYHEKSLMIEEMRALGVDVSAQNSPDPRQGK